METAIAAPQSPTSNDPKGDRLVPVLHWIARRADELSRQPGGRHATDLEYWLQAEREMFERREMCLESDEG